MSSPSTVYLVTGANRGIGLGLVKEIASTHPDAFIYAGVRNPAQPSGLDDIQSQYSGRIVIVKCISGDTQGNATLAKEIKARHGRVDTIIANAGIANTADTVLASKSQDLVDHFETNVVGPVVLFQAFHDLLKASASPRFVPISSGAGYIGGPVIELPIGTAAYGGSKAALNFVTRKMHFEHEWLTAFPLAPGAVITDMMNHNLSLDVTGTYAKLANPRARTVAQAATLLLSIIDNSTREKDSGEFLSIDGPNLPW